MRIWALIFAFFVTGTAFAQAPSPAPESGFNGRMTVGDAGEFFSVAITPENQRWGDEYRCWASPTIRASASRLDFRMFIAGPDGVTPREIAQRMARAFSARPSCAPIQSIEIVEDGSETTYRYDVATNIATCTCSGAPAADLWSALPNMVRMAVRSMPPAKADARASTIASLVQSEIELFDKRCSASGIPADPLDKYLSSLRRSRCATSTALVLKATRSLPHASETAPLLDRAEAVLREEKTLRVEAAASFIAAADKLALDAQTDEAAANAVRSRQLMAKKLRDDGFTPAIAPLPESLQLLIEKRLQANFAAATSLKEFKAATNAASVMWTAGAIDERRLAAAIAPDTQRFVSEIATWIPGYRGEKPINGLVRVHASLAEIRDWVRYLPEPDRAALADEVEKAGKALSRNMPTEPAAPRPLKAL